MTTTMSLEAGELDLTNATQIIDAVGRRWCMLGTRSGFFRLHDGRWYHGRRDGDGTSIEVTSPSTLAALDAWEAHHVRLDPDPTPPSGIFRPLWIR